MRIENAGSLNPAKNAALLRILRSGNADIFIIIVTSDGLSPPRYQIITQTNDSLSPRIKLILQGSAFNGVLAQVLINWGRVTHVCVGNLAIIGSDDGLSPGRHQAISWTNDWDIVS